MNRLYIQDRTTYQVSQREMTVEGYMRVPGRVAKTGTQQYLRRELSLDGNPNETVTVYRPPEEVFSPNSLATYNAADITVHHPKNLVDSKTFKDATVGVVRGDGRPDGDFVVCDIIIKDATAIKQAEDGLVELSVGYTAEYFDEKGVAPDGTPYDYVQRDIRVNHVALVPTARAGRQARLFDQSQNPIGTNMKTVVLDSGRTVEVQDENVAILLTDSFARLKATADEAVDKAKEAKADADRKQAKIDAMEEEAEKKKGETSDAIVADRIAQITAIKDKAKDISPEYTADSIDPVSIMRGVLTTTRATVDWAKKSDDYVIASFDLAHEVAQSGTSDKADAQKRQLAQDGANGVKQIADKNQTARDKYVTRMTTKEGA